MVEHIRWARTKGARLAGFVLASVLSLLLWGMAWGTAAYAQSREDQYGSPTGSVDHVDHASNTLSVLPETGGSLILLVAAAFILTGAGTALLARRGGDR